MANSSVKGPKIVVIGAGSYFFGKQVIYKMATSDILAGGTLALVDTNPKVLATMMNLAKKVFDEQKCNTKLIGSIDRREVMAGADFIVLTFSDRNAHFRGIDTQIAGKHGIRMCSSDTIGPGGIFRALREIPHVMAMAKDAQKLAPNAWVINFVNPTTVLGMALKRYMPNVKSFALCDGHHEPHNTLMWCKTVGILPEDAVASDLTPGLLIDEQPVIARGFDEPIREGMAFALEPKKGIPNVGMVGTENTYVVTPAGGRCLTGTHKGLLPVPLR